MEVIILTLFTACFSVAVYASYSTSIIYSKFNDTEWYTETLDRNYTSVTIDIIPHLTFNQTGTPAAKVAFMNETTDVKGIIVLFYQDNTEKVYLADGVTEVQIATGTWTAGNITRIVLASQKVTITDHYGVEASEATILDGFSFDKAFANVRAKGATAFTATDGYIQVDVDAGTVGMTSTIADWMPTLIELMMLGMTIGILGKMGGKW
jgi:hypothetical protein